MPEGGATMKIILLLFLMTLMAQIYAVPLRYFRPHPKPPIATETIRKTPWQTVVGGGVAGGTLIGAYKISNGVENGLQTVAKEKPEAFTKALSVLTAPIRYAWYAVLLFIAYKLWRWYENKKLIERKLS